MGKYKLDDKQNAKLQLIVEVVGLKVEHEDGIPLLNEIMDQLEDTDIVSEKAFKKLPISIQNFYNAMADIDLDKHSSEDEEKLDEAFVELGSLKSAGKGKEKEKEKEEDEKPAKGKGKAKEKEEDEKPGKGKANGKEKEKEKEEPAKGKGKEKPKSDVKDTREKDFPIGSKVDYAGKKEGISFKGAEVTGYHPAPATGIILKLKDGTKRAVTPKALALSGAAEKPKRGKK